MTSDSQSRLDYALALVQDERKAEAVATYVSIGTISGTARKLGINKGQLSKWRRTDWWAQAEFELKQQVSEEMNALMREVIVSAYTEMLDRAQNGDFQYLKGDLVRIPMKGKDLAVIAGITFDKLQLSLGNPTSISAIEKPNVGERAIRAMLGPVEKSDTGADAALPSNRKNGEG